MQSDCGEDKSAWHLDIVEILPKNDKDLCTSYFPCHDWIGAATGSKKTIGAQSSVSSVHADYTIIVATSNVKGAGTDANISIDLVGQNTHSGFLRLLGGKTSFDRGEVSSTSHCIYKFHLQVLRPKTRFCLAKGKCTVSPINSCSVQTSKTNTKIVMDSHLSYEVINIGLHDILANVVHMVKVDEFTLKNVSIVDDICSIIISSDGSGPNCEWHASYVVVERTKDKRTYKFDINQWIGIASGFQITAHISEGQEKVVRYELTLTTSNRK